MVEYVPLRVASGEAEEGREPRGAAVIKVSSVGIGKTTLGAMNRGVNSTSMPWHQNGGRSPRCDAGCQAERHPRSGVRISLVKGR
jgi:hypothetical protein